jgi:hypothetical protein
VFFGNLFSKRLRSHYTTEAAAQYDNVCHGFLWIYLSVTVLAPFLAL